MVLALLPFLMCFNRKACLPLSMYFYGDGGISGEQKQKQVPQKATHKQAKFAQQRRQTKLHKPPTVIQTKAPHTDHTITVQC